VVFQVTMLRKIFRLQLHRLPLSLFVLSYFPLHFLKRRASVKHFVSLQFLNQSVSLL
jgi:hypothetical protein